MAWSTVCCHVVQPDYTADEKKESQSFRCVKALGKSLSSFSLQSPSGTNSSALTQMHWLMAALLHCVAESFYNPPFDTHEWNPWRKNGRNRRCAVTRVFSSSPSPLIVLWILCQSLRSLHVSVVPGLLSLCGLWTLTCKILGGGNWSWCTTCNKLCTQCCSDRNIADSGIKLKISIFLWSLEELCSA